jgi:hypothetical protein
LPEIVQEIGSYAGIASVVGLAILSALYFSQARDVKRLREWAGRAPERAEQGQPATPVPGRTTPQPQQQPAAARPAAPPVPGRAPAVAAGARPAAATAAGQGTPAQTTPAPAGATAQAGTQAPPRPAAPQPAAAAAPAQNAGPPGAPQGAAAPAASQNAGAKAPSRPGGAPPLPPGGAAAQASARANGPSKPAPQPTAIIPPPRDDPWYRRMVANPRYVVLVIAGVLIVGGAAAFGITQLAGEDEGATPPPERSVAGSGEEAEQGDGNRPRRGRGGGAVNPASVTVAVLNGTTVPGLAATLSDEVTAAGFNVGTITNFSDQQLAESVVQYTPGHEREAAAVSRRLKISQREATNPTSQELAGDATVIVIAGADKSP